MKSCFYLMCILDMYLTTVGVPPPLLPPSSLTPAEDEETGTPPTVSTRNTLLVNVHLLLSLA